MNDARAPNFDTARGDALLEIGARCRGDHAVLRADMFAAVYLEFLPRALPAWRLP